MSWVAVLAAAAVAAAGTGAATGGHDGNLAAGQHQKRPCVKRGHHRYCIKRRLEPPTRSRPRLPTPPRPAQRPAFVPAAAAPAASPSPPTTSGWTTTT